MGSTITRLPQHLLRNLPLSPKPPAPLAQAIRDQALQLHHYRSEQRSQETVGHHPTLPTYLHEPASQLYQLHQQLDALVLQAYGFSPDDDLLEKLLTLNLALAEKEKSGEAIAGP